MTESSKNYGPFRDRIRTVHQLREALAELPEDMPIFFQKRGGDLKSLCSKGVETYFFPEEDNERSRPSDCKGYLENRSPVECLILVRESE